MIDGVIKIMSELEKYKEDVTSEQVRKIMKDHFQHQKRIIFEAINHCEESADNLKKMIDELKRSGDPEKNKAKDVLTDICLNDLIDRINNCKDRLNKIMQEEAQIFSWIAKTRWAEPLGIENMSDEEYWQQTDRFINERLSKK